MSYFHKHAVENTEWFAGKVRHPINPKKFQKSKQQVEGVSVAAIKSVLRELANHANDGKDDPHLKDWAWPSRRTLARESAFSPETVDNVLLWARHVGFFRHVQRVADENGQQRPNRYLLRELITVGGTVVTGEDGEDHVVGGKTMFKPAEGVEGGWAPDNALKGTVAHKAMELEPAPSGDGHPSTVVTTRPEVATTTPPSGHHQDPQWSPPSPIVTTTRPSGGDHPTSSGDHQRILLMNVYQESPIRQDLSGEGLSEQQQQQAAAAALSEEPCDEYNKEIKEEHKPKCKFRSLENELGTRKSWASALAGWFGDSLVEMRPSSVSEKWEPVFASLESPDYDLFEVLDWALSVEVTGKFKDKLRNADYNPAGLLKTIFPDILRAYDIWRMKQKTPTLEDNIRSLLASGETQGSDGETYRFVETKEFGPCWCREREPGVLYPVPVADAYGLDLPMPEDGVEYIESAVATAKGA